MSRIPRRWALFVPPLVILVVGGLWPLWGTWAGGRGAPTVDRLYVLGDFRGKGPLLRLERSPGQSCYLVRLRAGTAPAAWVCGRNSARVWVEDALIEVSVGARGVPEVSLAGGRFAPGAVIGSGADLSDREGPRLPLRGYGTPYQAVTVVSCAARGRGAGCIVEVHDRLGRLAVARSGAAEPDDDLPLRHGKRYTLRIGDELWLGLVPYAVDTATVAGRRGLTLTRVPRAVPDEAGPGWTGRGGDRRWLGRLWPVEAPDPADTLPLRFELYPSRNRYFPGNLSRQRTNYEGEDLLQRLVDGEWLCLQDEGGAPRLKWRPLERPGCGSGIPSSPAPSHQQVRDYQNARAGLLATLVGPLVAAGNRQLAAGAFLEAPTALPFAFGWELRRSGRAPPGGWGLSPVQPHPRQLWGVRFGATLRAVRPPTGADPRPDLFLRASTATHLVEVEGSGREPLTLYLAGVDPGNPARAIGSLCLDAARPAPRPTGGSRHYPLGAVTLGRDPGVVAWEPDPLGGRCAGCRLTLSARRDGELGFRVTGAGGCELLDGMVAAGGGELQHGDSLVWRDGAVVLRFLRRGGRAWVARSDARGARRYYAREFHIDAGLAPLIGDPAGLAGMEAALGEFAGNASDSLATVPLELTVDGDLQLAAAQVVARAAADSGVTSAPGAPARITAVVLDARTGEVLAAVSHFDTAAYPAVGRAPGRGRPSAWDLGTGRAHTWENTAFLRRGAIGSAMKVVGAYALVNHSLPAGPAPASRLVPEAVLTAGNRTGPGMRLDRPDTGRREPSAARFCMGTHALPLGDDAFTADVFVERFAVSCNNFFVLTGFRHASVPSAALRGPQRGAAVPAGALAMEASPPTLVQSAEEPLADRLRQGLATDAARPGVPPRSIYGLWLRLGFQPTPVRGPRREPADTFGFWFDGRTVSVPLASGWFGRPPNQAVPVLKPGRDFAYPSVPSPGRLDDQGPGGALEELYDGAQERVRTYRDDAVGRADVQYAQLLIGQGEAEGSALGLALMYAPAGRRDGRAVRPCVFRAGCAAAGPPVLEPGAAQALLHQALQRVLAPGGTAFARWTRSGSGGLRSTWGGKTGTYEVERSPLPAGVADELGALAEYACGVVGSPAPPADGALARYLGTQGARVGRLAAAPGAAAGAWACEGGFLPLNPGGIHRYGRGAEPAALDSLLELVRSRRERTVETAEYHAFVVLSLPDGGRPAAAGNPVEGIVIAVLVDHRADVAVRIGAELAAAAERWASVRRRPQTPPPGGS